MLKLKYFFVALVAVLIFMPAASALAEALVAGATHSSGYIAIDVVDQDGNPIGGVWFLYQGTGDAGPIIRNGTMGENFKMPWGLYYLRGQRKAGYESFEITSENPQEIVPSGLITYTLVYYEDGYAARQSLMEDMGETEPAPEVIEPEAEEPVAEPAIEPMEEEEGVMEEMFEVFEAGRSRLPGRTPLRVNPPSNSTTFVTPTPAAAASVQPMQLAVTGPESLLGLLLFSGLGSLLYTRRKK